MTEKERFWLKSEKWYCQSFLCNLVSPYLDLTATGLRAACITLCHAAKALGLFRQMLWLCSCKSSLRILLTGEVGSRRRMYTYINAIHLHGCRSMDQLR